VKRSSAIAIVLLMATLVRLERLVTCAEYNYGGVLLNEALLKGSTSSLKQAKRMFSRALDVRQDKRAYQRYGEANFLLGNFAAAEQAFDRAVDLDPTDTRSRLWLADALSHQGRTVEAITCLLSLLEVNPLERTAMESLDVLYAQQGISFAEEAGSSDNEFQKIEPGASRNLKLSLPATRPRWLTLYYLAHPDNGQHLSVFIDGQVPGGINIEESKGVQRQRLLVPDSVEDEAYVTLSNASDSVPFALTAARFEYVSSVEVFSDIPDATWTEVPHKVIKPGGQYETFLYAPDLSSRDIVVVFFDHSDRYLVVQVDGIEVGRIVGGVLGPGRRGGPTPFTFPIPEDSEDLVKVTLVNPGHIPLAVRSVYLTGEV
jgi:tetratricopeptide (TPR) repeat protein